MAREMARKLVEILHFECATKSHLSIFQFHAQNEKTKPLVYGNVCNFRSQIKQIANKKIITRENHAYKKVFFAQPNALGDVPY